LILWHDINCHDRILNWREWRQHIAKLSTDDCLKAIAEAWARAPQVNHYLSPDIPEDWPDPWQLINDNIYCDLSIALGMFYTVTLLERSDLDNVRLEIYQSNDGWINLCSINSGLCLLNWSPQAIVNTSTVPLPNRPTFNYSKLDLISKLH
jgi:hypothetical protein